MSSENAVNPGYPPLQKRQLLKLYNSLYDVVCALEPDGHFVYINDAIETVLGYTPEEMTGTRCYDHIIPEDRKEAMEVASQLMQGGEFPEYECRYMRKDGGIAYMIWKASWDESEQLLYATGRDITEKRVLEAENLSYESALKQRNREITDIINRITDGFIAVDNNFRITFFNKKAAKLLRKSVNSVMGQNFWECFPAAASNSDLQESVDEAIRMQRPVSFIFRESMLPVVLEVIAYPSANGLSIYFRDITDVDKADEERRLLSLIARETVNSVILTDMEGRITWVNESFTRTTGYTPEEVIGQLPGPLLSCPEKNMETKRFLDEHVRLRKPFRIEIQNRRKDGSTFWWEVYYQPLFDKNGNIEQFFSLNTDITERRMLQEQLEISQEAFRKKLTAAAVKASEAERTQVGRELHDNVNQVLTTVKLYTELLVDGLGNKEELLQKSSTLLQESIDEIRSLSRRLSAPTLGDIGVRDTLRELTEGLKVSEQINFQFEAAENTPLKIQEHLHLALYRIAQEQLTNILRHAAATEVLIFVGIEEEDLVLRVSDNGKGFKMQQKRPGIGLTNMMSRVEIYNGILQVHSSPGNGCILEARIPVSIEDDKCYPLYPPDAG